MAHLLEKPPPPKPALTILRQRLRPIFASNPILLENFEEELREWDPSKTGCVPTEVMKDILDHSEVQNVEESSKFHHRLVFLL
mmetsp:Transcript_17368/g.30625  ORF Transcript_17368/g.30625 Transcript_17368/m.30625 type:complete len:83 (+) Transcript_17368:20-268(+)